MANKEGGAQGRARTFRDILHRKLGSNYVVADRRTHIHRNFSPSVTFQREVQNMYRTL